MINAEGRILNRSGAHYCAKLLIVDDESANVLLLKDMLARDGYSDIHSTSDSRETLEACKTTEPDLILLDCMMPYMNGVEVMDQLRDEWPNRGDVPILMLTADSSPQIKRLALGHGATDFVTKPFDAVELLLRIDNLLQMRFLHVGLQSQNQSLEDRVLARTLELQSAQAKIIEHANNLENEQSETLKRLAHAGEFRDDNTGRHTIRVGETTRLLGQRLGYPPERLKWLQQAARLHDVGKIGIPDSILLKSGKLSEGEFGIMKTHTSIGAELLNGGQSVLFQIAERIALSHHEHWDGSGYPLRLKENDIPIEARLVGVADVFDALTHERPYKPAWSVPDAVAEITQQSGRQFEPRVVEAFLNLQHHALL
jgi:putative two-component system response regulator